MARERIGAGTSDVRGGCIDMLVGMMSAARAVSSGAVGRDSFTARFHLTDESRTERLGNDIAMALAPGDFVGLSGDLGAGKTVLARAILRTLAKDTMLDVPSPTFALAIPYELDDATVVHADLYRIEDEEEIGELGLYEEPVDILLVEWFERAAGHERSSSLACRMAITAGGREAVLEAQGPVAARLRRSMQIRAFLEAGAFGDAHRTALHGDASGRAYERLDSAGLLLMNDPPKTGIAGAPTIDAYSIAARRAPGIHAFIAIDALLRDRGFRAPRIDQIDAEAGLLLVEDLGAQSIAPAGEPVLERYLASAECLAVKDALDWPTDAPVDGGVYEIRAYDRDVLEVELSVYLDWRDEEAGEVPLAGAAREDFYALWQPHLDHVGARPRTLVLRDVHSPNILWQPGEEGVRRIGLIDFQDALIGDPAYDLASLAQDARVDVSASLEAAIVDRYVARRKAEDAGFDEDDLRLAFAILATQRATKIIGIFRRLHQRDGRTAYSAHLPRVEVYLGRSLAHPALADLRAWYAEHGG